MGLDQYLYAERYVTDYEFYGSADREAYKKVIAAMGLEEAVDPHTPTATVTACVAYWRKANQIHKWFVDNVQDGRDECQKEWVAREKLVELRDLCKKALAEKDREEALETLPPQPGFFFGSYEIDEWYWSDLEDTVKQLDRVLANVPEKNDRDTPRIDFYYQSSW